MLEPLAYAALGLETLESDVLRPAAVLGRAPADIEVWQPASGGRPSLADAQHARYRPVTLGWRWGPVWSTAWFRVTARLPSEWSRGDAWLRFSSGTEATLWLPRGRDGVPHQGFDPYRDRARIPIAFRAGGRVRLLVEAACNLPLGVSTFWWDHPEIHARWREATPGRLELCEFVRVDAALDEFADAWRFLCSLSRSLPQDSPRATEIVAGLRAIAREIDPQEPRAGMRATAARLRALMRGRGPRTRPTCVAVGHAHIDTAWLWPVAETRRKCLRTFANVARLMEEDRALRFVCSQAQQYAWVEEDSPALFREIAARVRDGRWEPAGAMWIEPDATCPSGESFVRQILHGTNYWRDRFGADAPQRCLWLPDTFGFPPCLPQIARLAGLDTFITNKMSWCESNRFPHVTFRWLGLDGTELVAHLTPGHNYNAPLEPDDLLRGERNLIAQDAHSFTSEMAAVWLQPFGHGDGGGGPTREQARRARFASACEGLPAVESTRVDAFCARLHDERAALRRAGRDLASWDGELYLELHRGTYTSQAWIKRQNRIAEGLLREVESLACGQPQPDAALRRATRRELDPLWKLVLLNQFHDILPGSSIAEVYRDARADHVRVSSAAHARRNALAQRTIDRFDTRGVRRPVVVRNPASTARAGVVERDAELLFVDRVPALGWSLVDAAQRRETPGVTVRRSRTGVVLANAWLEATIDPVGRVADLRTHGSGRIANARDERGGLRPLNQLVLYDDCPRRWEAWDIDRDYRDRARPIVDRAANVRVALEHPLRCEVRVERPLGRASRLFQTYRLDADSRRLDIRTDVEWHEDRTLLRALFPFEIRTSRASFGTQFGFLERSTHRNDSRDEARFEVPGHAWMDLSEPGFGAAVLDDGKYGRSAEGSTLGLSLLRSPSFPDPDADRGEHAFTYALLLHDGDWRAAGVDAEAEALREPLRVTVPPRRRARTAGSARLTGDWAPFAVEAPPQCLMQVAAFKPAETGDSLIVRLVEVRGGRGEASIRWSLPVRSVSASDLLEAPMRGTGRARALGPRRLRHDAGRGVTRFDVRPFQIVTLLVELAGARGRA